jgi:ABC-type enterochelin transport system ATPase subunit
MEMAGVTLDRISKRFDQTEVLKEISLSIADGGLPEHGSAAGDAPAGLLAALAVHGNAVAGASALATLTADYLQAGMSGCI